MKILLGVVCGLIIASALVGTVHAQSGPVNFLGAIAGTTKAVNCGTPTTPSMCIVGDGVWIWQNAAQGWFLAAPAPVVGPVSTGVQKVNGIAPDSTGNVTVPIPSKVVINSVTPTGSLQ